MSAEDKDAQKKEGVKEGVKEEDSKLTTPIVVEKYSNLTKVEQLWITKR